MGRKVKCVDNGEYSTSDVAFKAPNNHYFSSEEAYLAWDLNNVYRTKCIDLMYELLNYQPKMIIPTYFYQKLKKWVEGYNYQTVYNTMVNKTHEIEWALQNKEFNAETVKIMYLCAIIENNLTDTWKQQIREERVKKQIEKEDRSIMAHIDINTLGNHKTATNVTSLIGDIE